MTDKKSIIQLKYLINAELRRIRLKCLLTSFQSMNWNNLSLVKMCLTFKKWIFFPLSAQLFYPIQECELSSPSVKYWDMYSQLRSVFKNNLNIECFNSSLLVVPAKIQVILQSCFLHWCRCNPIIQSTLLFYYCKAIGVKR